jgi:hypothetical protein
VCESEPRNTCCTQSREYCSSGANHPRDIAIYVHGSQDSHISLPPPLSTQCISASAPEAGGGGGERGCHTKFWLWYTDYLTVSSSEMCLIVHTMRWRNKSVCKEHLSQLHIKISHPFFLSRCLGAHLRKKVTGSYKYTQESNRPFPQDRSYTHRVV